MSTRILSAFNLLKRVGFAVLYLGVSFFSPLNAAPLTVKTHNITYFIANEGQWEGDFQFKCEVGSAVYYVTTKGLTVDFREFKRYPKPRDPRNPLDMLERQGERDSITVRGHVVQIHYVEGNARSAITGEGKLPHYSNYFLGRDSTKWRSRVGHYQNIIVPEVWPGIDVEYRADKIGVETVYHVKPGADPMQIQMEYLGLDAPLRVDAQGNLVLATWLGDMKEKTPFAFQLASRTQQRVESRFRVVDDNRVMFELDGYDSAKELVVDPLIYSTYFANGLGDDCRAIDRDSAGNVLVSGTTYDTEFPITEGAYQDFMYGDEEPIAGFITKFDSDFSNLLFSTFFDVSYGKVRVRFAPDGTIWWVGEVSAERFALLPGALDSVNTFIDLGIARLTADGTELIFSSFLGGEGPGQYIDSFGDLKFDQVGNAYVTGATETPIDFPITPNALEPVFAPERNGFLSSISPTGDLLYSTFINAGVADEFSWASDLNVVGPDLVWLTGVTFSGGLPVTPNAFQSEFNPDSLDSPRASFILLLDIGSNEIRYCSYWGGRTWSQQHAIVLGNEDTVVVGDYSTAQWLEMPPSAFQTTFTADGATCIATLALPNTIVNGTYYGVGNRTSGVSYNRASDGTISCVGLTNSFDLPVTDNAFDTEFCSGPGYPVNQDIFVARFSPDLTRLLYGSYLGGCLWEDVWDTFHQDDTIFVVGVLEPSFGFPITPDALYPWSPGITSGFITEITAEDATPVRISPYQPTAISLSAYPNPFNPTTTLSFTLPRSADVALTIRNVLGQEVVSVSMGRMIAGEHRYAVNAERWATGIYFATLNIAAQTHTTKLLLIR